MKNIITYFKYIILSILLCNCLTGCTLEVTLDQNRANTNKEITNSTSEITNEINSTPIEKEIIDLSNIPEYKDKAYIEINNNKPFFNKSDIKKSSFEIYSELDSYGRCQEAIACIGIDLMPTEERESIGAIKPSGWKTVKYDGIDGNYLYNRCHLIGFQLTGENANKQNLITGTRYMNVEGMLPFENMVADYLKENKENHVMYRVTPIFENDNLVASGVLIEAMSVEDEGKDLEFNVYCYNVQPGITIDYKTGESVGPEFKGSNYENNQKESTVSNSTCKYILNTSSKKFHFESCSNAKDIKEKNKQESNSLRDDLIKQGYSPCGACKP